MNPLALAVDPEPGHLALLCYTLEHNGFRVVEGQNGREAVELARMHQPSLVVLNWTVPMLSALEVCRQLRRAPETRAVGIIILGAFGAEVAKVAALNSGADDYIAGPTSPSELIARLRTVLQRVQPSQAEVLRSGDVSMDLSTHRVRRNSREVKLGPTEFRLLRHFLQNPGRVFTRSQLLTSVWGGEAFVEARTVDVHVLRLRKAINGQGEPDLIRTVRSAGYALELPADDDCRSSAQAGAAPAS